MKFECKLCMEIKPLIRAHIIPRYFYAPNSYLISDNSRYKKKRPIGSYDQNILCTDCDNLILGKFDGFAKRILFAQKGVIKETLHNPAFPMQSLSYYRLKDKNGYDKLNRFFLSILWRASISTQEDFLTFNLGLYEQLAKKAVLEESYDYEEFFSITICLLNDIKHPIHLFSAKSTKIEDTNCYIAIIGFFKVIIRCDKRRLPPTLQEIALSPKNDVLMLEGDLMKFPEHKIMLDLIVNTQHNQEVIS